MNLSKHILLCQQALILLAIAPLAAHAAPASKAEATAATAEMEAHRQANIKTVMAYYDAYLKSDFDETRKFIGSHYIEHDPEHKDGLPGLQLAFELEHKSPSKKTASHQIVIADGDLVVLMSQLSKTPLNAIAGGSTPQNTAPGARPGPPPAISTEGELAGGPLTGPTVSPAALTTTRQQAEVFRLEDGKIVEHWITIQGLGNP